MKMTQREVAEGVEILLEEGFAQAFMSKIEFGQRDVTLRELTAISVVLECDIDELDPKHDATTEHPRRHSVRNSYWVEPRSAPEPQSDEEPIILALWEFLGYVTEEYPEGALRIGEKQWLRYRISQDAP